jgi:hypothetical protein
LSSEPTPPRRSSVFPLLATIAVLGFAASLAFGALAPEKDRLAAMRLERLRREADLLEIRAEADSLQIRRDSIETDPYLLEREFRDSYRYVGPNEWLIDAGEPSD